MNNAFDITTIAANVAARVGVSEQEAARYVRAAISDLHDDEPTAAHLAAYAVAAIKYEAANGYR